MEAAVPGGVLLWVAGAAMDGADVFVLRGVRKLFVNFLSGDFLFAQIMTPAKARSDEQNSRASKPKGHDRTAELTQDDQRSDQKKSRDEEPLSVHGISAATYEPQADEQPQQSLNEPC